MAKEINATKRTIERTLKNYKKIISLSETDQRSQEAGLLLNNKKAV